MLCCEKKKKKNTPDRALCTRTVAQELADLFEKTVATKTRGVLLFVEIYCLMMERIEIEELDPVSTENMKFLYQRWVNHIPSLLLTSFSVKNLNLSTPNFFECPSQFQHAL